MRFGLQAQPDQVAGGIFNSGLTRQGQLVLLDALVHGQGAAFRESSIAFIAFERAFAFKRAKNWGENSKRQADKKSKEKTKGSYLCERECGLSKSCLS